MSEIKVFKEVCNMASIKGLLNNLAGQTEARLQAQKEVALLMEQANMKLDILENELKDLFKNKELERQIPIIGDEIGPFEREYRFNYEDGNVSDAVDSLVDQIMTIGSERIQQIIVKAITNALNAMFTNVETSEEERRLFIIALEGVKLVRYDIYVWRKTELDSGLFKYAKSVVAITYARSIVDFAQCPEDEINDAIYASLRTAGIEDILEYKKFLVELFKVRPCL